MKFTLPQQLAVAAAVTLLAAVWFGSANRVPVREIDAVVASRTIAERGALVIDVRPSRDAYDRERVPGAVWSRVDDVERTVMSLGATKDRAIVVYCGDGNNGEHAVRTLTERGYTDVANVKGGLAAWKGAELPLAR